MADAGKLFHAIGVISSVAGDRVEAAIIETDGRDHVRSIGGVSIPSKENLRWGLLEATQNDLPTSELLRVENDLTDHYRRAVDALREKHPAETAACSVIGLDGHTLRHLPGEGLLLQIGNPWRLAELTGLPVVTDFRRFDMALGGQGGPLEAMFHWALMAAEPRPALMVNLGAVTSLTWLSRANDIRAGDVGPGMEMLDEWLQEVAEVDNDLDGSLSAEGTVNADCLKYAFESPFFARPLPKAAARSDFERIDVSGLGVRDGAATICAVIAESVKRAIAKLPERPQRAWVTGAGSRNRLILEQLAESFDSVENVDARDRNPDTLEAECFAWLAVRYVRGLPVTTPETTGCRTASCEGLATSRTLIA